MKSANVLPAATAFDRSLGLTGATNCRDLGGYTGHQGQTVRWRKLLRSNHLGTLTAVDIGAMMNGGVTRVFDFRGREERLSAPCVLPGAQVQSLSIEPSVVKRIEEHLDRGAPLSPPQMVAYMQQTYRDFVAYNTPRFAELFAAMLQSDAPLVFHCTAGKDRTGVAAALILLALGADKDVVMHDYLLTNMYLKHPPDLGASRLPPLARAVLYGVQADFLEAAFTEIDLRFGGLDAYLAGPLGLGARELGELRRCYLQS